MEQLLEHSYPFAVSFLLLVWFKTNAFCEYLDYFNLGFYFYTSDYKKKSESNEVLLSYPVYLSIYHCSFFTRLLSCPICVSVWLNFLILFPLGKLNCFFVYWWLSLVLYFLIIKLSGEHSDGKLK